MESTNTTIMPLSKTLVGSVGYLQAGILASLSVVVISGNVLTIMAVYRNPQLRTVPNLYLVSLASADILDGVAMIFVGFTLVPELSGYFIESKFLCMSKYSLVFTSMSASAFSLNAIAVDRYIYILHPMKYLTVVTFPKAFGAIACSWILAVTLGTMPGYVNTWAVGVVCLSFHVLSIWYQVVMSVLLFGACTGTIMYCYGRIIFVARKQMKRIQNIGLTIQSDNSTGFSQLKQDWKLIKMFIFVFGVFFVCWAPAVVGVYLEFGGLSSDKYMGYALMLGTINSGMNVFIYAYKNEGFRRAFKKILCGRCCRKVFPCCDRPTVLPGDLSNIDNNTTLTRVGEYHEYTI